MSKTLLVGAAAASLLALGAHAQQAPTEPETTPPATMEQQLPSVTSEEPAATVVPDAASDTDAAPAPDAPAAVAEDPATPASESVADDTPAPTIDGWTPVDLATVTPDMMIGKDVRTYDEETIAAVEDLMMSADGKIEGIVVRYGGLLGFGETRVLLDADEVTVVGDADQNAMVLTSVTADELKSRPEYIPPEG